MCQDQANFFATTSHLIPAMTHWGMYCYCPHCIDEQTKAQKNKQTCPQSYLLVMKWMLGFEARQSDSRAYTLCPMFYCLLYIHGFQILIHHFSNIELAFLLFQGLCQTPRTLRLLRCSLLSKGLSVKSIVIRAQKRKWQPQRGGWVEQSGQAPPRDGPGS